MNTFFDYLEWRGDLSFDAAPFNEVDAGILSRLVYEPFELVTDSEFDSRITVGEAIDKLLEIRYIEERLLSRELDLKFMELIKKSSRFSSIQITGVTNRIDINQEYQFAAMVYVIGINDYFLCYRGTDKNLVAWKEDLNMGVVFPVPAQLMALEYFEDAAFKLPKGNYRIGGHSKGGNLSVYAAAFCDSSCQSMVSEVYNFDGPGFNENVMERLEYKAVSKRINTFVPQFSIVGMILDHLEDYSVVYSNNAGILQHEPLSWGVNRDGYLLKEKVDSGSRFIDSTLKIWLSQLNNDERSEFIETIYEVLTSGNATEVEDLLNGKNVALMFRTYAKMDATTKKKFRSVLGTLVKSAGVTAGNSVASNTFATTDKVVRRIGRKRGV